MIFNILKSVPVVAGMESPGLLIVLQILNRTIGKIDHFSVVLHLMRLPHSEKPIAVPAEVPFQTGDFPAQLNCFTDDISEDRFSVILHHLGRHIQGGDHAVLRRGGAMHHIGFIEQYRIDTAFCSIADVEHGCL